MTLTQKLINFKAQISLEEGIIDTISSIQGAYIGDKGEEAMEEMA